MVNWVLGLLDKVNPFFLRSCFFSQHGVYYSNRKQTRIMLVLAWVCQCAWVWGHKRCIRGSIRAYVFWVCVGECMNEFIPKYVFEHLRVCLSVCCEWSLSVRVCDCGSVWKHEVMWVCERVLLCVNVSQWGNISRSAHSHTCTTPRLSKVMAWANVLEIQKSLVINCFT